MLSQASLPSTTLEIKKSRFIGYAARIGDEDGARTFLAGLRHQHLQARHICHGFVIGPERGTQRSSDDGEPGGTAGVPILEAILHRQDDAGRACLSDVVVAVVRYFGGTKLGASGLVQAYTQSAAATLDAADFTRRQRMRLAWVRLDHASAARLETSLRDLGYQLSPTSYGANDAVVNLAVPAGAWDEAAMQVNTLTSGAAQLGTCGEAWQDC